jgi:hypothetical protein
MPSNNLAVNGSIPEGISYSPLRTWLIVASSGITPRESRRGGLGEGGVGKSLGESLLILIHACLFLFWLSPGLLAVAMLIGVEDFSYHAIGTLLEDGVDSSVLLPGLLNLDQLFLLGFELGPFLLGLGSSCRIQVFTPPCRHKGGHFPVFLLGGHQLLLSFLWCDMFESQLDAQLLGNSSDLQLTDNESEGVLMDQ